MTNNQRTFDETLPNGLANPDHYAFFMTKAKFYGTIGGNTRLGRGIEASAKVSTEFDKAWVSGSLIVRACRIDASLSPNPIAEGVRWALLSRLAFDTTIKGFAGRHSAQSIRTFRPGDGALLDARFAREASDDPIESNIEQLLHLETKHAWPAPKVVRVAKNATAKQQAHARATNQANQSKGAQLHHDLVGAFISDYPQGMGLLTPGDIGQMQPNTLADIAGWVMDNAQKQTAPPVTRPF
jgi:hypothetical protein